MSYTVKVTIDSVETDITDYVVRGSVSRDFILHKDLKPTTSTAGLKVLGSYRTLLDSLLLSKAEVPCTILKDSSPYFTGIISPKYSLIAAQARAEQVSIQVEDFNVSRLKRQIDSNVKLTGYYISDPVTPSQSIIHALAALAGVDVDSTTSPSILVQVPIYVVLSDDDRKYEDELTNLLYTYGYVYYFNESGELAFYFFGDYDTSEITTGFKNIVGDAGSNCLAIKVEKSRETYDKIKIKWHELELKQDQVLFEDTTDGDAEGCNIKLDSGEYYPEGSGEADVYSEYELDGLVGAVEASLQATSDSGISIATSFMNYGKKALFSLRSSADNQYITKLRIVGDAYVQKSKNFTIETINVDVQNILDYESLYIFDKAQAAAFGLILHNYYQYSDFNYLIKSKSTFALGAYVKIEDDIHLSITAYGRIREIKENSEGVFAYYIEGITEYIAVGDTSTAKNQSPTTLASKVAQVISGMRPLPPDNNVTDVVFDDAQNADGSVRVTATWNYVQGTNKADAAFIYYKGSIVGAPGAFDYALDPAAAKPMDVNGEYSWSGNFPGRTGGTGGAPIRWRFGVVAARISLLHSSGAVTPPGWADKMLVPVIQDIDFNLYDKAFTSYEGSGPFRRAVRVSGNRVAWLNAPSGGAEVTVCAIKQIYGECAIQGNLIARRGDNWVTEGTLGAINANVCHDMSGVDPRDGRILGQWVDWTAFQSVLRVGTISGEAISWGAPIQLAPGGNIFNPRLMFVTPTRLINTFNYAGDAFISHVRGVYTGGVYTWGGLTQTPLGAITTGVIVEESEVLGTVLVAWGIRNVDGTNTYRVAKATWNDVTFTFSLGTPVVVETSGPNNTTELNFERFGDMYLLTYRRSGGTRTIFDIYDRNLNKVEEDILQKHPINRKIQGRLRENLFLVTDGTNLWFLNAENPNYLEPVTLSRIPEYVIEQKSSERSAMLWNGTNFRPFNAGAQEYSPIVTQADFPLVFVRAHSTVNQACSAWVTNIVFHHIHEATPGTFNGTTFIAPVSGLYLVNIQRFNPSGGAELFIFINGLGAYNPPILAAPMHGSGSQVARLVRGQQMTFRINVNATLHSSLGVDITLLRRT